MNWNEKLDLFKSQYDDIAIRPPLQSDAINVIGGELNFLHLDIIDFYSSCNGLTLNWLNVYPIEDPGDVKRTWQGLHWANSIEAQHHLGGDEELLARFLVFASIGDGYCAAIDRTDGSLWYEEDDEFHQTTLSTSEFIETCLKEANE